jgi:hypothetical protein
MVLFINPLVADHVCKANINVAQSFLDQEIQVSEYKTIDICLLGFCFYMLQESRGSKKANATTSDIVVMPEVNINHSSIIW